jgi:pimeloyl-ACP methyl ester carboxylesterase
MARTLNTLIAALLAATPTASSPEPVPRWARLADVPASPSPGASGFVTSAGASLYYAAFNPDGHSPVILLHGGLGSSGSWGFEIPLLARRHAVIVVDSRGHGRSSRPAGPLHYDQMAADHEQFIARSHTESLAKLIPGAKLLILPNVGHGGPQQDPRAFHRAVEAFLDSGRRSASSEQSSPVDRAALLLAPEAS